MNRDPIPLALYRARQAAHERRARLVYVAEVVALCIAFAMLVVGLVAAIVWIS